MKKKKHPTHEQKKAVEEVAKVSPTLLDEEDIQKIDDAYVRELQQEIAVKEKTIRSLTWDCIILGCMFVVTLVTACAVVHDANQTNVMFEQRVSRLEHPKPVEGHVLWTVKSPEDTNDWKKIYLDSISDPVVGTPIIKVDRAHLIRELIRIGVLDEHGDYAK